MDLLRRHDESSLLLPHYTVDYIPVFNDTTLLTSVIVDGRLWTQLSRSLSRIPGTAPTADGLTRSWRITAVPALMRSSVTFYHVLDGRSGRPQTPPTAGSDNKRLQVSSELSILDSSSRWCVCVT